jgi:acid phosphatase
LTPSHLRLAPLTAALLALANPWSAQADETPITGVVAGAGYYQNARVCIDANANGRCDSAEASVRSGADGSFRLKGSGPVVAEIGTDALLRDPLTHRAQPVAQALALRAPARDPAVVSSVSTELQALIESHGDAGEAVRSLAQRLQLRPAELLADPNRADDSHVRETLLAENGRLQNRIAEAVAEAGARGDLVKALANRLALDQITNVVVIFAENRSFDNLYGAYPGANGLKTAAAKAIKQVDRDGVTVLPTLPPAWSGMTAAGQTPVVTQAQTTGVWPNAPFQIDAATDLYGYGTLPNTIVTRDLYHRFFENQMQANGGRNNQFSAWGDSGGLTSGYYDGSNNQLWALAKQYTLADNFFQGAWGGSFLNHQYLICACAPSIPAAVVSANAMSINVLAAPANGVPQLAANSSQQASALNGPPSLKTGNIAPLDYFGSGDGYRAVNTMQAPYQPSGNKPADAVGNDPLYAAPTASTTVPPQTQTTIGDLLTAKGLGWTWYSGGWAAASANPYPYNASTGTYGTSTTIYNANSFGTADASDTDFQPHHQPFNYYAILDPVAHAADRAQHLNDRSDLIAQAQAGSLPPLAFYKPVGFQNQHPGYTNVTNGDAEIAGIVAQLQQSPQWPHMLILITYDEFGGQFDHVAPPRADLLGPGTRIPALVISPFAKKGFVDHTQYDTDSALRFVTNRYSLPLLPGLQLRDSSLVANGGKPMGDLTNALSF